eukprot:scaffold91292_cov22-Tisochrysis_lutea.AAC.2
MAGRRSGLIGLSLGHTQVTTAEGAASGWVCGGGGAAAAGIAGPIDLGQRQASQLTSQAHGPPAQCQQRRGNSCRGEATAACMAAIFPPFPAAGRIPDHSRRDSTTVHVCTCVPSCRLYTVQQCRG